MIKKVEAFILSGYSFDSVDKQILKFYGQSSHGTISITIDNFQNYFFVEDKDINAKYTALDGKKVSKVLVQNQKDLKNKKSYFESNNLRTYESDIKLIDRYLIDNKIYAQVTIEGPSSTENEILNFYNPLLSSSTYYPDIKIYSFDIETGKDGRILSLAYNFRFKDSSESKCIVLGELQSTEEVFFCRSEKEILQFFQNSIQRLDPDIITGWNVIGFDLKFIANKSKKLDFPIVIGRSNKTLDLYQNLRGEWHVNLDGRVVIDGPRALKMNFFSFDSFKLNSVAKDLLGEGKDIDEDEVHDKWDEIERRFREDKFSLAKYNLKDAELVLDIFENTKIIDLLLNRSLISGMLLERVGGSTAAFDHFYLPALHEKNIVALNTADISWAKQSKGGFVITPEVGIHENVMVLDFKSLYPTIIQTFKIDPLSNFYNNINPISTPVGLNFSYTENILPKKIEQLLEKRAHAKKINNTQLSQAVKILMNSFYGVMGSDGCRFYHENLPDGVTGTGQWILKEVKLFLEKNDLKVLYGDTDSIFVQVKTENEYSKNAKELTVKINKFISGKIKDLFGIECFLEIQFDKFFKKLILTSTRGQGDGAKKRYAGLSLIENNNKIEEKIIITGMEYVRSDWSNLAKKFQFELLRRIFYGEDIGSFIHEVITNLELGKLNDDLFLTKRLSKPIEEYTKNVPPHARAAKMLYEKLGIITDRPKYIMSKRGPIPIELPCPDIDYDYYINKQIAPVADSVLSLIGKNFNSYQNGQMTLF